MKFEIKNRYSASVIFSVETDSWKLAVEAAVKSRADLSEADLSGAELSEADLSGAELSEANLSEADLSGAELSEADLSRANLSGANLSRANLFGANLSRANLFGANLSRAELPRANLSRADLSRANLSRANLSEANLSEADLSGANLSRANLSEQQLTFFRDDIWAILSSSPLEVRGLRQAIIDGKINGSSYEGDCACLVGTIAKVAKCNYKNLPILKANSKRMAEVFFMLIKIGDTPKNSKCSKLALQWIDQWLENMEMAFGSKK